MTLAIISVTSTPKTALRPVDVSRHAAPSLRSDLSRPARRASRRARVLRSGRRLFPDLGRREHEELLVPGDAVAVVAAPAVPRSPRQEAGLAAEQRRRRLPTSSGRLDASSAATTSSSPS